MKLVVGLGNPGRKHVLNRHNLGFLAVDSYVALSNANFGRVEFGAETARLREGSEDVLVLKPQTYMNRSGDSVGEAMRFFKLGPADLIVLHDELDVPPMSFRIKKGGGHGGHNGLRSIQPLGEGYLRFRLGVGRPPHPAMQVADFVLGNLSQGELDFWEQEMPNVAEAIRLCVAGSAELAMNKFHRKEK